MDTIVEVNGMLYVAMRDVLYDEPTEITNYYPLGIQSYGMESYIGRHLTLKDGLFRDEYGRLYALANGAGTKPTFTDRAPVPEPSQRGRKLECRWMSGRWHKNTRNGWRPA